MVSFYRRLVRLVAFEFFTVFSSPSFFDGQFHPSGMLPVRLCVATTELNSECTEYCTTERFKQATLNFTFRFPDFQIRRSFLRIPRL